MKLLLLPLLILLNVVFALSEVAVLSAREARLRALADQGQPGALRWWSSSYFSRPSGPTRLPMTGTVSACQSD